MLATSDLQNAVAGYLEIANTADTLTSFNVLKSLNSAQLHILNTVPDNFIDTAVKTVKGDLEIDTHLIQWPSDFIRIVSLYVDYKVSITATNRGRQAIPQKDLSNLNSAFRSPSFDYPVYSDEFEGGFELMPVPDTAVTDGFRLKYVQKLLEMSATQDCLLNDRFNNLLVFWAASLSALTEGYDKHTQTEFQQMYNIELRNFR